VSETEAVKWIENLYGYQFFSRVIVQASSGEKCIFSGGLLLNPVHESGQRFWI
jgi:hypothetical protein